MNSEAECKKVARRLGCRLEINRKSHHVTIWLPDGKQVQGSDGLDCLCNDGSTLDEVWPTVLYDLETLLMEDLAS